MSAVKFSLQNIISIRRVRRAENTTVRVHIKNLLALEMPTRVTDIAKKADRSVKRALTVPRSDANGCKGMVAGSIDSKIWRKHATAEIE